jgi:DNA-binding SARP family transcriptional activator
MVKLTMLGTFALEIGGQRHTLPTRKSEALIAYLALRREGRLRRDTLAALLWGDVDVAQARHSLRQALWQMKRTLAAPGILRTEGDSVRLEHDAITVDVPLFERLAASAGPDDQDRAAALYGGELLDGLHIKEVRFDAWLSHERSRLHQIAIDVRTRQLQWSLATGTPDRSVAIASALLALDGTQEPVHRTLMRLYWETGRPADALRQYNLCSRILQQELGVEPDAATRQLCQEILVERARGSRTREMARSTPDAAPVVPASDPAVLVLESDPLARASLERILKSAGYAVALRAATGTPTPAPGAACRAIICGLSGSSSRMRLLSRLKSQGYQGSVLFVSDGGPWLPPSAVGGLRVDYLRRPVRPRALLAALRNALATGPPEGSGA